MIVDPLAAAKRFHQLLEEEQLLKDAVDALKPLAFLNIDSRRVRKLWPEYVKAARKVLIDAAEKGIE